VSAPAETFVALLHHPVYDRNRQVVSTALTNLDLHDIARASRTYGLGGFFIVHPVTAQRKLAERIAGHWLSEGATVHDFRRQAIERLSVVADVVVGVAAVAQRCGGAPAVVATSARSDEKATTFSQLRGHVGPMLLVLGTGWGLTDEALARCHLRLRPLRGPCDYNHLSVRSACAIILDRLYGDRED
jgi:hypothetical protein